MHLEQLTIRNFRCFAEAKLELDRDLNWIVGQNASGKTSLLEALFFLGHGRSFRSSRPDRLTREGQDGFELVARLNRDGRRQVLGVGRRDGATLVRLAGETLRGMAEAAKALPVIALDSGMNHLISRGPAERRRWLDWGVFHVEQSFLPAWREFQQALRQRNEGLKANLPDRALAPWDEAVARAGENLNGLRQQHFERLQPLAMEYARRALPEVELEFAYRKGWAEDDRLDEALRRHAARDRELGSTRYGPHRADVQLRIGGLPAEERLSRGQQKLLAGAMWLAQLQLFTRMRDERPLLLVDDLAAELDGENLVRFLALLTEQSAQLVLTAITDTDVARAGLGEGQVFHVEHGRLRDTC